MLEVWKEIPGFENYEVSNFGEVRRLGSRVIRKMRIDCWGYKRINFRRDEKIVTKYAHTLVAQTFLGAKPEGKQCRHIDGDQLNNCVSNLRWGTPKENCDDRAIHGRALVGKRNHKAKLSEDEVRSIRARKSAGAVQADLAREFGVSQFSISRIVNGSTWKHVSST